MKLIVVIAVATLVAAAGAHHVVVPSHWSLVETARDDVKVPITIALKQRNLDRLKEIFDDVSNPQSPNWRKFLTKKEISDLTSPTRELINEGLSTLKRDGAVAVKLSSTRSFIDATFTVERLRVLLGVNVNMYKHSRSQSVIFRSPDMYTLPQHWTSFVDIIGMVSEFPEDRYDAKRRVAKLPGVSAAPVSPFSATTSTTCNGSAIFGYPYASQGDFIVQVTIQCCNGQTTTNLTNPCGEYGNEVTYLNGDVKLASTDSLVLSSHFAPSQLECFMQEGAVTCNYRYANLSMIAPYDNYVISCSLGFANGDNSNNAVFPVPLVATPFLTPQSLWRLYGLPSNPNADRSLSNSQGVASFGGQYYSTTDLQAFMGNMSLPPNVDVTLVGPDNSNDPGDEASLDIQWIMAMGVNVPTYFWSVGKGYLLEWAKEVQESSKYPYVFSISYGGNEANSPVGYRNRVDTEISKLGAMGITVMVSSGDAGSTNVGHGSDACSPIQPQYPASSPYVTSVSATFMTSKSEPVCYQEVKGQPGTCGQINIGEVAVAANNGLPWTTGGGFSSSVPRPSYQNDAVNNYMSQYPSALPAAGSFNSSNRAYPDVSAIGHNLMVYINGVIDIADGTSASSPIFAGVVSHLNDYLLLNGDSPLGPANTFLYQAMNSYVPTFYVGSNQCGDVLHPPYIACCPASDGYQATRGWDAVTGIGTPKLPGLIDALGSFVSNRS